MYNVLYNVHALWIEARRNHKFTKQLKNNPHAKCLIKCLDSSFDRTVVLVLGIRLSPRVREKNRSNESHHLSGPTHNMDSDGKLQKKKAQSHIEEVDSMLYRNLELE